MTLWKRTLAFLTFSTFSGFSQNQQHSNSWTYTMYLVVQRRAAEWCSQSPGSRNLFFWPIETCGLSVANAAYLSWMFFSTTVSNYILRIFEKFQQQAVGVLRRIPMQWFNFREKRWAIPWCPPSNANLLRSTNGKQKRKLQKLQNLSSL